jgi:hypothetical protein
MAERRKGINPLLLTYYDAVTHSNDDVWISNGWFRLKIILIEKSVILMDSSPESRIKKSTSSTTSFLFHIGFHNKKRAISQFALCQSILWYPKNNN